MDLPMINPLNGVKHNSAINELHKEEEKESKSVYELKLLIPFFINYIVIQGQRKGRTFINWLGNIKIWF